MKYILIPFLLFGSLCGPVADAQLPGDIVHRGLAILNIGQNDTLMTYLKGIHYAFKYKIANFKLCYNSSVGKHNIHILEDRLSDVVHRYFDTYGEYIEKKTIRERIGRVIKFIKSVFRLGKTIIQCMKDIEDGIEPTVYGFTQLSGYSPTEFEKLIHGTKTHTFDAPLIRTQARKKSVSRKSVYRRPVYRRPVYRRPVSRKSITMMNSTRSTSPKSKIRFEHGGKKWRESEPNFFYQKRRVSSPARHKLNESECTFDNFPSYRRPMPKAFTWQDKNVLSEVRFQGMCGSCWLYNPMDVAETYHRISNNITFKGKGDVRLSVQEILDCSHSGCNGGFPDYSLEWLALYGASEETVHPYKAKWNDKEPCIVRKPVYKIKNYCSALGNEGYMPVTTQYLKAVLLDNGPIMANINGEPLQHIRGEFNGRFPPGEIGHSIALVGWNEKYWILKNSWGPTHGIKGYTYFLQRETERSGLNKFIAFILK